MVVFRSMALIFVREKGQLSGGGLIFASDIILQHLEVLRNIKVLNFNITYYY